MLTRTRMAATLAVGSLWFGGIALAQTGAVYGEVTGQDGDPLKGALVRIERIGIRGNFKVKSNKKGKYYHGGLPLGQYNVSLEVDGKIVNKLQNARVDIDGKEVNFDLAEMSRAGTKRASDQSELSRQDLDQMTPQELREWEKFNEEQEEILSKNKKLNAAFNAGKRAYRARDFQTAVSSFSEAAGLEPDQHVVWGNLANAEGELAKTKTGDERKKLQSSAFEHYRKAIALDPENASYRNNLGLALARNDKLQEAVAELEAAANLDPLKAGTYFFNLGAILVNTGKSEEAVVAFRKAIEVQPNYAAAHYQLATALVGAAKINDDGTVTPVAGTLEAFQKYLELEPDGPFAAACQQMIQGLQGKIETEYQDPEKGKRKRRKKSS